MDWIIFDLSYRGLNLKGQHYLDCPLNYFWIFITFELLFPIGGVWRNVVGFIDLDSFQLNKKVQISFQTVKKLPEVIR